MMTNPFYDSFKQLTGAGGFVDSDPDIGKVYQSVLYQRGFGFNNLDDFRMTHGLGFADGLMNMFKTALPYLKTGLQYLGKQAVNTAAGIAKDTLMGDNIRDAAKKHATQAAGEIFAEAPNIILDSVMNKRGTKRKAGSSTKALNQRTSVLRSKKAKRGKRGFGILKTYPALENIW